MSLYTLQERHGDRWLSVNHGDDLDALDCQAEHRAIVSGAAEVRVVNNQTHRIMPLAKSKRTPV